MNREMAAPMNMADGFSEDFTKPESHLKDGATQMTDNEIVELFCERNEKAIAAAAEKYGRYCAKIAKNILQNEQDAEECVNDTYMKVWEKIPPEKPRILAAFMARLTRNQAIDRYRREHSGKRGGGEAPLIFEELSDCVSDGKSIEQTAERHEILAAVNKFLNGLPSKKRVIFVSRYCYCESVHDIAERFGINDNNVSVTLNRTRKQLCEYLKREGYEL